MKTVLRALMAVAIVVAAYLCYASIQKPITFENQKEKRQAAVIERLIAIRTAEVEFKDKNGHYTADFDSLINFVKTEKKAVVSKEGRIEDAWLAKGLNEKKALALVKNGTEEDAAKYGIDAEHWETFKNTFKRDTVFVPILEASFKKDYPIDSIAFVPYTNNAKFEVEVNNDYVNKSGTKMSLFEARVPYDVYLNGLERGYVVNLNEEAELLGKYKGLKVGDKETPNNNAGNWE